MSNNEGRLSEKKAEKNSEENAREGDKDSPEPVVSLDFSVEVHELLTRAESDPASAMKLLVMLAKNLRARTLPSGVLADYVADAIEATAAKPTDYHARALTDELHLTSQDRRPKHSWVEVGYEMYSRVGEGNSQTKAKVDVAAKYDLDERTVLTYYKKFMMAKEAHDKIE